MKRRRTQQFGANANYQLQVNIARRKLQKLTQTMRRGQAIHDHAAELLNRQTLRTLIDRTGDDDDEASLSGGSDDESHIAMYQRQRLRARDAVAQTGNQLGTLFMERNDLQEALQGLVHAQPIPSFDHHRPFGPADWNWSPDQTRNETQYYVNTGFQPTLASTFITAESNRENTVPPPRPHPNIMPAAAPPSP